MKQRRASLADKALGLALCAASVFLHPVFDTEAGAAEPKGIELEARVRELEARMAKVEARIAEHETQKSTHAAHGCQGATRQGNVADQPMGQMPPQSGQQQGMPMGGGGMGDM